MKRLVILFLLKLYARIKICTIFFVEKLEELNWSATENLLGVWLLWERIPVHSQQ